MGNDVEVGVRGDVIVDLTNIINATSEDNFAKVIEQLGSEGLINTEHVNTKFSLIQ